MKRKGGGRGGRSERMAMVKMMRARGGAIDREGERGSERGWERERETDGRWDGGRNETRKTESDQTRRERSNGV